MKQILAISFLTLGFSGVAQNRATFNQYMINPGMYNPGYIDIFSEIGASVFYKRQWLRQGYAPQDFIANGHYNISRNHGIGVTLSSDANGKLGTLEAGANYVYHIWIRERLAIGFGIKASFYQQSLNDDFTYFDTDEPLLEGKRSQMGLNLGTGFSMTTQNFDLNIGLPYLFANYAVNPDYLYDMGKNHFYASTGYKFRIGEGLIIYPTVFAKGVSGSPIQVSADANVMINQLLWLGLGYKTNQCLTATAGVYLDNGFRFVYSFESGSFSGFKNTGTSHELSIGYARPFRESPFRNRKYQKRNGSWKKW